MNKRIRVQFYAEPTFEDVERQFDEEIYTDPGPGMTREATAFVLSPFYTRAFDQAMEKPSAQKEALAGVLIPFQHNLNLAHLAHLAQLVVRAVMVAMVAMVVMVAVVAMVAMGIKEAKALKALKARLEHLEIKARLEHLEIKDLQVTTHLDQVAEAAGFSEHAQKHHHLLVIE